MEKRFILVFLLCLFCCSCGVTYQPKPSLPQQAIIKGYPLKLVLYQSEKFNNFKHFMGTKDVTLGNNIDIGRSSSVILLESVKKMFGNIVVVDNAVKIPKDYDGLLEPTIIGLYDISLQEESSIVELVYYFKLSDNNKKLVKQFKITGKDYSGAWFVPNAIDPAIKDAMAQLLVKLQNDTDIQAWLTAGKEYSKQKVLK